MPERRVWRSKITNIFERKLQKYSGGVGSSTVFRTDSAGWYVTIGGEITIYVGVEKPEFEIGDAILLSLQKESNDAKA